MSGLWDNKMKRWIWVIFALILLITSLGGCQENSQTQADNPQMTAVEVCDYVGKTLTEQENGEYIATSAVYQNGGVWIVSVERTFFPSKLDVSELEYFFNENTATIYGGPTK